MIQDFIHINTMPICLVALHIQSVIIGGHQIIKHLLPVCHHPFRFSSDHCIFPPKFNVKVIPDMTLLLTGCQEVVMQPIAIQFCCWKLSLKSENSKYYFERVILVSNSLTSCDANGSSCIIHDIISPRLGVQVEKCHSPCVCGQQNYNCTN